MKKYNNNVSGFTLIELSIVIVIIGLIVAGVVAGQSLVRQAQLRSVLSDAENVKASVNSFLLQYSGLPGDLSTASSYFANCNDTADGDSAAECNGDGNKQIIVAANDTSESYMAWLHLARAGIFSGSFVPGLAVTGTIGTNIPASNLADTGMTLIYDSTYSGNYVRFGAARASNPADNSVMTPPEGQALDAKADDGAAETGSVRALDGNGDTCIASNDYVLSTTTEECVLLFAL